LKPPEGEYPYPFWEAFLISSLQLQKDFIKKECFGMLDKEVKFMAKEMNRREFLMTSAVAGVVLAAKDIPSVFAHAFNPIQLLPPQLDRGRPLMQVLKDRKSWRAYTAEEIPLQVLSNLLWAAFGVNRPESGKRTAPSGLNLQNTYIYVATSEGVFVYDGKAHSLYQTLAEDVRPLSGRQQTPPLDEAPINIIYVADLSKFRKVGEQAFSVAFANSAFISQNVYLFCASEGLATVVRLRFDKAELEKAMKLQPDQYITLVQSLGYPKK
jgi:SagB-type dehydrogenase family enzyme